MADFPSKVTTETGSPSTQSSQQGGNSLRGLATQVSSDMDMSFVRSIPAILMVAEIVLGLLHWSLIASTLYAAWPAYGWVMFVAVTSWLLTLILFFIILFRVQRKLSSVPWTLVVMIYYGVVTLLYLTAFITNAASVYPGLNYGHYAAAAVSLWCFKAGMQMYFEADKSQQPHTIIYTFVQSTFETTCRHSHIKDDFVCQFFAAVVTVAYGGSAFFAYLDWRDDGGNAATNTVPT
ncbi:hypothetical protein WMY93_023111 [Mugilogobius chulae]|uniref:Plasmolipin n=1 Tax=Mugilogobius chulae TaxID=88201 RepID=A0AAW0N3E7_9GOBI